MASDDNQPQQNPLSRSWDSDSAYGADDDNDSRSDMSYLGSTQSLSSSVLNYTYENGRRYHAFRAGQYFMPNDEHEQEAMDLMHHFSSLVLKGELYRAPIGQPEHILDIGTGTGIWAIDVADKFPGAHVIAIDLSPIQPTWVPPNLEFRVDDCESDWEFNKEFDFIHMRNLSGSIADWPKLLKICFDHLKPGGWIEVSNIETWAQSNNRSVPLDSASFTWLHNLQDAARKIGRELNIGPELYRLIGEAGFENVEDDQHKIPLSPWMGKQDNASKELLECFQLLVSMELEALSLRLFTGVLGWNSQDLHVLLASVRKETIDPANEMFTTMHYVYGRKPKP